jgi:hypothetical protein
VEWRKEEASLDILPLKNERKEEGRSGEVDREGRVLGGLRERSVLRVDHSRRELFFCLEMRSRK